MRLLPTLQAAVGVSGGLGVKARGWEGEQCKRPQLSYFLPWEVDFKAALSGHPPAPLDFSSLLAPSRQQLLGDPGGSWHTLG